MANYLSLIYQMIQRDPLLPVSTLFIIIIIFLSIIKKANFQTLKFITFLYLCSSIIFGFILIYLQFKVWKSSDISKYLLPPFYDISYFLEYSLFRFFRNFYFRLFGFLAAVLWIKLIIFILKRDPFYEEEKILIPLLTLFLQFPYNSLFLLVGFIILMVAMLIRLLFKKLSIQEKKSPKNLWLFIFIVVYILQPFLFKSILLSTTIP